MTSHPARAWDSNVELYLIPTSDRVLAGGANQFSNNGGTGLGLGNGGEFGAVSTQTVIGSEGANRFNGNAGIGLNLFNGTQFGGVSRQAVDLSAGANSFSGNGDGIRIINGPPVVAGFEESPHIPGIFTGRIKQAVDLSGANRNTGNADIGLTTYKLAGDRFVTPEVLPPNLDAEQTVYLTGMDLSGNGEDILDDSYGEGTQIIIQP